MPVDLFDDDNPLRIPVTGAALDDSGNPIQFPQELLTAAGADDSWEPHHVDRTNDVVPTGRGKLERLVEIDAQIKELQTERVELLAEVKSKLEELDNG